MTHLIQIPVNGFLTHSNSGGDRALADTLAGEQLHHRTPMVGAQLPSCPPSASARYAVHEAKPSAT